MRRLRPHLAGDQITHHHAPADAGIDDQVEHLGASVQLDRTAGDLALQGLRAGDLQLLAGLAAGVVGPRDLHAAERPGGQGAPVFAGERRADGIHVVDHPHRLGAEPERVGLTGPEIATLDGVGDESLQRVTVHLLGTGRVDATLRGHRVCAASGVVVSEGVHVVTEFAQGGRRARTGQSGAHHHDGHLLGVEGADQLVLGSPPVPGGRRIAGGNPAVEVVSDSRPGDRARGCDEDGRVGGGAAGDSSELVADPIAQRHEITPVSTSTGIAPLPIRIATASSPPMTASVARQR